MTISIVVVNWNAGPGLAACLASVGGDGAPGRQLVLVDNASNDGSLVAMRPYTGLQLVQTGANLGFAAGANRGAAVTDGEVLVFLNPDAQARPGAVETLCGTLATIPGVGIAGGGLEDARGGWQPGWAHFGPVRHLLLDTALGRLPARWRRAPHVVDWVYGTFMAVRRDLFQQLGGFDTRYFLYGEDIDLCYRARRLGARTLHVPAARAVHGGNVSATQRFGHGREAEVVKGELRFYADRGRGTLRLFRALAACKFGTKATLAAACGRATAAATYARVVGACVRWDRCT